MSEISKTVEANSLMDVSEFEQELAVSSDHSRALEVRFVPVLQALLLVPGVP
jgi:hypothetical protein